MTAGQPPPPRDAADTGTRADLDRRAAELVGRMALADKLHQCTGDRSLADLLRLPLGYQDRPFTAGDAPDLGIPPLRFTDGPRGVMLGRSTAFPVPMARGATFDPDLEERIGDAIGVEARTQGADLVGAVCVNLLRHPAWGRAQETYGEDPHHLGEMGAALVRGLQRHAMACVKHYACNSMEDARFHVDVRIDERTLREVYLAAFRRCVDAGAAVVMTAYNKVNGLHTSEHPHLLRDILRDDWGFDGITISDWVFAVRDGVAAMRAGCDVEMPAAWRYRRIPRAVRRGALDPAIVDEAARRVVRTKLRFASVGEPDRYRPEAVAGDDHRALARQAAREAMVLLRNTPAPADPVLPIDPSRTSRLAVIGRLADLDNTGDRGSSRVRPPSVVTPLAGLRGAFPGTEVTASASDDPHEAARTARDADAAVVVVGSTWRDEGENMLAWGGDRTSLRLSPAHERLIAAVADVQPRTVVVLVTGSAVVVEPWLDRVPAVVVSWYAGMEGGRALADLLTGAANFSGRLPCVFPRRNGDLPPFDAAARVVTYEHLHGYRWCEAHGHAPSFPFGFGLGYTTFAYGAVTLDDAEVLADGTIRVHVEVANTGARAGTEVVQCYVSAPDSRVRRAPRDLRAFARVDLDPGERRTVTLAVPVRDLAFYDAGAAAWVVEPLTYRLGVGPSSDPSTHREIEVRVIR